MASRDEAFTAQWVWFSRMWVVAGWFHLWNQVTWPQRPWTPTATQVGVELLMIVAGIGVLRRPAHTLWMLAFVALEVVHGLRDVPRVANHWYLTFLMATMMLGAAGVAWRRAGHLTPQAWSEAAAPGVRVILLVGYAWAAFAKFNTDFLTPEVSCASTLWNQISAQWIRGLPTGPFFDAAAIGTTLVVEAAVPLLLCSRWRYAGVLLGATFHFLISFTPVMRVPDFAAMLLAGWFLFLPPEVALRLDARLAALDGWFPRWRPRHVVGVVVLLHAIPWGVQAAQGRLNVAEVFQYLRIQSFTVYGIVWLLLILLCLRDERGEVEPTPRALRLQGPLAWTLVCATLLSGVQPYVGLRTRANLSMFSNLRTEDHRPNHLLMPQVYLVDHQNDLVEIVRTDIPKIQEELANGYRMTFWELRYRSRQRPDGQVTYRRAGVERTVERVGDDPELSSPPAWWEEWLFVFRPVDHGGGAVCQW